MQENNVFAVLNALNCNEHTERKGNLTYLSWAWRTCWVKTGVTIGGLEHIEYLPVMDARNQSIPLDSVRSVDVNKTIQRSLTKACARHGLGLYIYAGEDLPDSAEPRPQANAPQPQWRRQYYQNNHQSL